MRPQLAVLPLYIEARTGFIAVLIVAMDAAPVHFDEFCREL